MFYVLVPATGAGLQLAFHAAHNRNCCSAQ